MKLLRLKAENVKGQTFDSHLTAITFLVGSNAVGKSARLDALLLLLLGYHPKLGKRGMDTFRLCSGRDMTVEGWFDDGSYIKRRWYLKGDSVKTETILPTSLEGENPVIAAMLDPTTYFGLSERERIAYVAANVPNPGGNRSVETILEDFKKQPWITDEIDPKASERFSADLALIVTRLWAERQVGTENDNCPPPPLADFVELLLETIVAEGKKSRDYGIQMEKTAQGLLQLRAADAPTDSIASLEARKVGIEKRIADLRASKESNIAEAERIKNDNRRREELNRTTVNTEGLKGVRDAAAADFAKLKRELDEIPMPDPTELAALNAERRDADSALARHEADLAQVEKAIRDNEGELAGIDRKEVCPYCGASGEGWKEIKRTEIVSALAGLRSKAETYAPLVVQVRNHAAALTVKIGHASEAANRRLGKANLLAFANTALAEADRRLEAAKAREAEIAALVPYNSAPVAAVEYAQSAINIAEDEKRGVERSIAELTRRSGDLKRLAEAEEARDKAKLDEKVAKSAADWVRELKAKMVTEVFGPLLASANAFFGSALASPISYHEGEVGRWAEGIWISNKVLSGKEELLVFAGISAALASRAPCRMMIMDEMNRLDAENAKIVAERLTAAVAEGRLDGFIGVDLTDRWWAFWSDNSEGLTVAQIS